MDTLVRDLGILAALIVIGLLWRLYSTVTRRRHRQEVKADERPTRSASGSSSRPSRAWPPWPRPGAGPVRTRTHRPRWAPPTT